MAYGVLGVVCTALSDHFANCFFERSPWTTLYFVAYGFFAVLDIFL